MWVYYEILWDKPLRALGIIQNLQNLTLIASAVFYAICWLRIHRQSLEKNWDNHGSSYQRSIHEDSCYIHWYLIRQCFDEVWPDFIVLAFDNSNWAYSRQFSSLEQKSDFQWTITRDWQGGFLITSRGNHELYFSAISILLSVCFPSKFMFHVQWYINVERFHDISFSSWLFLIFRYFFILCLPVQLLTLLPSA